MLSLNGDVVVEVCLFHALIDFVGIHSHRYTRIPDVAHKGVRFTRRYRVVVLE